MEILIALLPLLVPLVGSALGGAIITSIFGVIKHNQEKQLEHRQWLRNRKIDVYTKHLNAYAVLANAVDGNSSLTDLTRVKESFERLITAEVDLIATPEVRVAVTELDQAMKNYMENFVGGTKLEPEEKLELGTDLRKSMRKLQAAFRKDLDISSD